MSPVTSAATSTTGSTSPPSPCRPLAERQALLAPPWPGNIRELENVIHFALIVNKRPELQPESLRLRAPTPAPIHLMQTPAATPDDPPAPLQRALKQLFDAEPDDLYARIEESTVRLAFDHCYRNQVRTAALPGIRGHVLRAQLKRYGRIVDRPAAVASLNA